MTHASLRLLAPSEIAEMAGVSRAAVSNWSNPNRDMGFPARAGGSEARPLFDADEVEAWLTDRGYTIQQDRGERAIWSLMNRFRGEVSVETLTEAVMATLAARYLAAQIRGAGAAWDEAHQAVPGKCAQALIAVGLAAGESDAKYNDLTWLPDALTEQTPSLLPSLIDEVSRLRLEDLSSVGEYTLTRLTAAQARSAGEHGLVGSRVSRLLANIASTRSAKVVYDPACGIAETLLRARESLGDDARFVGHEINRAALRLAAQRCLLIGMDADLAVADVLVSDPDGDLTADLILAEPPLGASWSPEESLADPRWVYGLPRKASSETAWLQHCISHLSGEGRAYVITAGGPLFRGGPERLIRTNLLRAGCVETVVALPGKMLPHTSIPLTLWVLRRPHAGPSANSVLFLDAAETHDAEERVAGWLAGDRRNLDREAAPYAVVDVKDLLAEDSLLQPHRWIHRTDADPVEIEERYRHGRSALDKVMHLFNAEVLPPPPAMPTSPPRVVTVRDLVQRSAASLASGRTLQDADALGAQTITARHVKNGLKHLTQLSAAEIDHLPPGREVSQAGDVLVTTMNDVRAVVDDVGGHLFAGGVYRLRVDPAVCDPEYLAYCLAGSWNARHQMGTTIQRAEIKALEVPMIPLDQQRQVLTHLDASKRLRDLAQDATRASRDLSSAVLDAVRYGVGLE